MYLYFVDEFKIDKRDFNVYGLVLVRFNNASYMKYKRGFYEKLKSLGWNPEIEIKGRHSFSASKGDVNIPVEERLNFVQELFELSKSTSGVYASAQVFFSFDVFPKKTEEKNMYLSLLIRMAKKLPKGSRKGNKNGNNNALFLMDENNALDKKTLNREVEKILELREIHLIEKCFFIDSDNESPGILFADHISYFIQNLLKTSEFNETILDEFRNLFSKFKADEDSLSEQERERFKTFIISIKKEEKSRKLIKSLKKMELV